MKFAATGPYVDPEKAARRIVEIAMVPIYASECVCGVFSADLRLDGRLPRKNFKPRTASS